MTALDGPRALDSSRSERHVRSTPWAAAFGTALDDLQLTDPLRAVRERTVRAERLALGQVCLLTRTQQRLYWKRVPAGLDLGDTLSVLIVHA